MHAQHDKPASFHGSPQEAMQAPPEEFLYLACLHEGTGVEKPDFLAVVDAEKGEIVHELPMPNVGDELHHFGWNRCSSACHGPDRSHLIVPGFRSSRIHIVNVADDPRRAADREGDRAGRDRREDRLHAAAHRPLHARRQHRHLDARRRRRQRRRRLRRARREDVRGQGPLGERRRDASLQLRLLVPATQERARLVASSASRTPTRRASTSTTSPPGATAAGSTSGTSPSGRVEQTLDLGETGLVPLEVRWLHDPDAEQGFVGAALSSTMWHFRRDNGGWEADQVIAVEGGRARGLAVPRARPDHRPRPLDGRPLPLLRQLAARRRAPVRRLRPARSRS